MHMKQSFKCRKIVRLPTISEKSLKLKYFGIRTSNIIFIWWISKVGDGFIERMLFWCLKAFLTEQWNSFPSRL